MFLKTLDMNRILVLAAVLLLGAGRAGRPGADRCGSRAKARA